MPDTDVQVAVVTTSHMHDMDVSTFLRMEPGQPVPSEVAREQRKDPAPAQIIAFIENETLPAEEKRAKAVVVQASVLTLVDNILYYVDSKQGDRQWIVVPEHLRKQIMEENHSA